MVHYLRKQLNAQNDYRGYSKKVKALDRQQLERLKGL